LPSLDTGIVVCPSGVFCVPTRWCQPLSQVEDTSPSPPPSTGYCTKIGMERLHGAYQATISQARQEKHDAVTPKEQKPVATHQKNLPKEIHPERTQEGTCLQERGVARRVHRQLGFDARIAQTLPKAPCHQHKRRVLRCCHTCMHPKCHLTY